MSYFLGVDMGTSSIKATLLNDRGEILLTERLPVELICPGEGMYEVDAVKTWWNGFVAICRKIQSRADLSSVRAVCVSSVCGSFVPVDADFNPLYNAILYGIDTRALKQIAFLNEKCGPDYLREHVGGVFNTHSIIPKILWLKEHCPEVYDQCRYFVASNNFVTARLTGEARWDYPTAAGARLVDFPTMGTLEEVLAGNGLHPEKIPSFDWPLATLGEVTRAAAEETGLSAGTAVVVGACDINSEAMAIGAINPGDLVVVYGSTISTLLTVDRFLTLSGFNPGVSVLEGSYRLGAASSAGARSVAWVDEIVGKDYRLDPEEGPTGIIMLPYIDGARTPFHNPHASGVFFGLRRTNQKSDLYRAAREALGFEVAATVDKLSSVYPVPKTIKAMGGMANDHALMQIISNVTGMSQQVYQGIDASYGAALFAMGSELPLSEINDLPGVRKFRQPSPTFTPDEAIHGLYQPLSEKYQRLYASLLELF